MHLVGQLMEPIMKFFLFPLQVLKLLEFDFVFPLLVTDARLHFFCRPNDSLKVSLHFSMLLLELNKLSTLFSCLLKWLWNLLVTVFLLFFESMSFLVLAQSILQIDLQLLDDVEIRVPYIEVKVLDLLILLGMLLG